MQLHVTDGHVQENRREQQHAGRDQKRGLPQHIADGRSDIRLPGRLSLRARRRNRIGILRLAWGQGWGRGSLSLLGTIGGIIARRLRRWPPNRRTRGNDIRTRWHAHGTRSRRRSYTARSRPAAGATTGGLAGWETFPAFAACGLAPAAGETPGTQASSRSPVPSVAAADAAPREEPSPSAEFPSPTKRPSTSASPAQPRGLPVHRPLLQQTDDPASTRPAKSERMPEPASPIPRIGEQTIQKAAG